MCSKFFANWSKQKCAALLSNKAVFCFKRHTDRQPAKTPQKKAPAGIIKLKQKNIWQIIYLYLLQINLFLETLPDLGGYRCALTESQQKTESTHE